MNGNERKWMDMKRKWKENERKMNGNERKIKGNERKMNGNGRNMKGKWMEMEGTFFLTKNWKFGYPKKIGVLYCGGGFYWIWEKWRTLLRTGLLKLFEHYACHALVPPRVAACLALIPQRGLSRQKFRVPIRPCKSMPCFVSIYTLGRVGPPKPNWNK